MPDKWAQYAQAPQPGDKWAQYAAAPTPPEDSRNDLQRSFDKNTQTNPNEPLLETGLKSVVHGASGMVIHPWEAAKSLGSALIHSLNPGDPENPANKMAAGAKEDYQAGGLPYALTKGAGEAFGNAALGAGIGAGAGIAGKVAGPLAKTVGKVTAPIGEAGGKLWDQVPIPTRAKAGAMFEDLNQKLANQPVKLNQAIQPLQRVTEIGERGSTMPTAVTKLLQRSQSPIEMTFPEARDYQGSLSDLSQSDKLAMNGRVRGGVAQLNQGLFGDIQDAANTQGLGEDYAKAMRDYRRASQLNHAFKTAGKYGAGAVGAGALYKLGKDLTP